MEDADLRGKETDSRRGVVTRGGKVLTGKGRVLA